ncbi:hypothetical protein E8E14_014822 [Neopestalotiopsis sp. 37M]|nr:hypothetical protein E8E14_014822 [Neopestalotiopsis sp. 37M]
MTDQPRALDLPADEKKIADDVDKCSLAAGTQSPANGNWLKRLQKSLLSSAETRGIDPVPVEERTDDKPLQLFTLWFTSNCTLLPITTGMVGTLVLGLNVGISSAVIILSTLIFMFPVAWMGMMGPKTGMRQIVQSRYYFGYDFVLVIALLQLATLTGYTIITSIVSGQTLKAVSQGELSLTVGIVITVLGALPISFMGYKFLHYIETYLWIPSLIAFIIAAGVGAKSFVTGTEVAAPTARNVLTFACACASLCISWAALVSDYSVYINPRTPRYKIFVYVYAGYCLPSTLLLILGAAIGAAVSANASWAEAYENYSVGGVIYTITAPIGGFGNLQSLHPIMSKVPRYIYSIVIAAIVIPVAIVVSSNFYDSLSNFLSVVGYWTAAYMGIALAEHYCFRKGCYESYHLSSWNKRDELPFGLAAFMSLCCTFGLIVLFMDNAWYTGPVAVYTGDIGLEVGIFMSVLFYIPLRYLEVRFIR